MAEILAPPRPVPGAPTWASLRSRADELPAWLGVAALFALALIVRWSGRHQGLIYPDGYQYLLMARGIGAHLTPTVQLGAGGYEFAPSVDAALKPLYPALIAAVTAVVKARTAAALITAVSAAAVVALTGALGARLTGIKAAGALAGAAVLLSPTVAYWSGFSGPDPLAIALAEGCALALLYDRGAVAGVLGGLCATARPEWGISLLALALAALAWPSGRRLAGRALPAAMFTVAAVLVVLRPGLAAPKGGTAGVLALLAAAVCLQLIARFAGGRRGRSLALGLVAAAAVPALALGGESPALHALISSEWPLFVLGAWGLVVACRRGHGHPALALVAACGAPAAAYLYRNPSSGRYLAELVPAVCILGSYALLTPAPRRDLRAAVVAGASAMVGLMLVVSNPYPAPAPDSFQTLAASLKSAPPGPLVSVAPDAYGYLLPGRVQRMLAPGARGLILLDAAQRLYAPGLGARGHLIATLRTPNGFERPDGSLDTAPARLIEGVVVTR